MKKVVRWSLEKGSVVFLATLILTLDTIMPAGTRTEEARMLALLRKRLDEARGAGEVDSEDLRITASEAGIEEDAASLFRALVRSNLVRLRGRWREGVSGVTAPVYVARLTGRAP